MNKQNFHLYPDAGALPSFHAPETGDEAYIPSPELIAAVNVALSLGQPLLVTGLPGTGKTRLAYHIKDRFPDLEGPFRFNAQTSSVKKDLFYTYDALGHFQWAQNQQSKDITSLEMEERFIRYEAFGNAIRLAQQKGKRSVILIDEIDKAPRDLPNDLLAVIEDLVFEVPEIPGDAPKRWECPKKHMPVIIITSNSEKDLPEAFLRRVVYHHIDPPLGDKLVEILQAKKLFALGEEDFRVLVEHFLEIQGKNLGKNPATAELIAWAALLPKLEFPVQKLKDRSTLTEVEKKLLRASYGVLAKNQDDLQKLYDSVG